MAQMVVLSSRHLVFVMSQVLCLPPGVKDESDMLPALRPHSLAEKQTQEGYVQAMLRPMPPQCLGND